MNDDDLLFGADDVELSERLNDLERRKVALQQSYAALSRNLESLCRTLPAKDWLRLNAPL